MKCVICKHGETRRGKATITLNRGETVLVFKGVPAEICENCGEYYLDEATTGLLLSKAERAVENGAEVDVLRFAA